MRIEEDGAGARVGDLPAGLGGIRLEHVPAVGATDNEILTRLSTRCEAVKIATRRRSRQRAVPHRVSSIVARETASATYS
jgi:hypothetical protein